MVFQFPWPSIKSVGCSQHFFLPVFKDGKVGGWLGVWIGCPSDVPQKNDRTVEVVYEISYSLGEV